MVKSVRVGVWGLGRHGRRKILPALNICSDTSLVGVTTRDRRVAKEEAARHGCHAWRTPEEMLNDPDVDAVYVATPTGLHYAHGARVLQAGKHLWCEKAMTATLPQAQELVQLSRENDRALCEAFMYLYHPQFTTIHQLLIDGSLGKVVSLRSQFGIPRLEQPGFRFNQELGGGALLDLAVYPLSAALTLLGPELELLRSSVVRPAGVDVDTHGLALLMSETGAGAYLEWGYERAYKNELSIWGEDGSLHADFIFSKPTDYAAVVSLRSERGELERVEIQPADSFSLMFRAFSEAVRDPSRRDLLRQEIGLRASYLSSIRSEGEAFKRTSG